MQQGGHNLGHSKHRKAFDSKQHKSGFGRILLQKDENQRTEEKAKLHESHKSKMFPSVAEALRHDQHRK